MLANDKLLCLCVYCYNCVVKNRHYGLPQNYEIARNYNSDFEVETHEICMGCYMMHLGCHTL